MGYVREGYRRLWEMLETMMTASAEATVFAHSPSAAPNPAKIAVHTNVQNCQCLIFKVLFFASGTANDHPLISTRRFLRYIEVNIRS
jgi:hypothetical protein